MSSLDAKKLEEKHEETSEHGATVINSRRNGVGTRLTADCTLNIVFLHDDLVKHGWTAIFLGMVDKDNACTWWNVDEETKLSENCHKWNYGNRIYRQADCGYSVILVVCEREERINIILWEYFKHWIEDWQGRLRSLLTNSERNGKVKG